MPFDGSGVYNPIGSPDFPAVAATTIRAAQYNNAINDIASALTNCVTRDGQSAATADLPMGGNKHTNVAAAALRTQYARAAEVQDGTLTYLTSVAGVDTITATAPLALAAYSAGQNFRFVAAGANTGAVTLNINGLGAKAVVKNGATVLTAGDIPAGSIAEVTYDGTQFQLQTPAKGFATAADLQSQVNTAFTTSGTGTAYTLTPAPAITSNAAKQRFNATFHAAPGASPTLAVSGQTALPLKYYDATGTLQSIVAAQFSANFVGDVIGDGTNWIVINAPALPGIPQISISANYTLTLSDANKHVLHPSSDGAARTVTIPDNSSVPFPIGTAITFVNNNSNNLTLATVTDTLAWANGAGGATGNRTLGVNAMATMIKVYNTVWMLSGVGIT